MASGTRTQMEWSLLLHPKRIRFYLGEQDTQKAEGDKRGEFERDYGRSLYSTPVRRLRDKAQVFPLEEHDW